MDPDFDDFEDEDEHSAFDCYRCQRPMPVPPDGQRVTTGWRMDPDGDVVYCPEHIPGPPPGWKDEVITFTKAEMNALKIDPAKVPEKYRHLFE